VTENNTNSAALGSNYQPPHSNPSVGIPTTSPSKRFVPRITTTPSKSLAVTNQLLGDLVPGSLKLQQPGQVSRHVSNSNNSGQIGTGGRLGGENRTFSIGSDFTNLSRTNSSSNLSNASMTRSFSHKSVRNFGPGL
jgi:hypothetical protein